MSAQFRSRGGELADVVELVDRDSVVVLLRRGGRHAIAIDTSPLRKAKRK